MMKTLIHNPFMTPDNLSKPVNIIHSHYSIIRQHSEPTALVRWLGLGVGGHLALILHSSYKPTDNRMITLFMPL